MRSALTINKPVQMKISHVGITLGSSKHLHGLVVGTDLSPKREIKLENRALICGCFENWPEYIRETARQKP